jgi:hypothetical protein
MPPEYEESEDLKTTRGLLGDILLAFARRTDLPYTRIEKLYREYVLDTAKREFPGFKRSAWDLILFQGNARKYAYLPGSDKGHVRGKLSKRRIGHVAEVAGRALLQEDVIGLVSYDDLPTWPTFLAHVLRVIKQEKVEPAQSDNAPLMKSVPAAKISTTAISTDLQFIGGNAAGLKKFLDICEGATFVFNTVFTRTEEQFGYLDEEMPAFQEAQRKLLSTGRCVWNDIVESSEAKGIMQFYESLDARQKAKYHPYKLLIKSDRLNETPKLPLLQCVVMRSNEIKHGVLIGWSFSGTHNSRVYFSDHLDTYNYFLDYCEALKSHCVTLIPRERPSVAKRRLKKKPSARKKKSK